MNARRRNITRLAALASDRSVDAPEIGRRPALLSLLLAAASSRQSKVIEEGRVAADAVGWVWHRRPVRDAAGWGGARQRSMTAALAGRRGKGRAAGGKNAGPRARAD